jgi:hypothetical protein
MRIDDTSEERHEPMGGDAEGEPDEAYDASPAPQMGRLKITERKKREEDEPEKKDRWWRL